jgi:hypothetical protein
MYKFRIGLTVFLERSLAVPGGACVVTKQLPERDGEFQYRVKSAREPHERVVRESQLSATP